NFTTIYDVFVRARCGSGFYSIWTDRNRFSIAGIDTPQDEESSLSLYPNPADNEVSVIINSEAGEYSIDIVDMKGRIVKTQVANVTDNTTTVVLDISTLARGTYFAKISNGETKAVRKLIAQ
ncbi:MAG: T9SS type A sorting domain-containing protein, partial [Bacteroidales bacterium]|nr:T9SS type A sorting domain-containing protein [Bacteroidales bacterium]